MEFYLAVVYSITWSVRCFAVCIKIFSTEIYYVTVVHHQVLYSLEFYGRIISCAT